MLYITYIIYSNNTPIQYNITLIHLSSNCAPYSATTIVTIHIHTRIYIQKYTAYKYYNYYSECINNQDRKK